MRLYQSIGLCITCPVMGVLFILVSFLLSGYCGQTHDGFPELSFINVAGWACTVIYAALGSFLLYGSGFILYTTWQDFRGTEKADPW